MPPLSQISIMSYFTGYLRSHFSERISQRSNKTNIICKNKTNVTTNLNLIQRSFYIEMNKADLLGAKKEEKRPYFPPLLILRFVKIFSL